MAVLLVSIGLLAFPGHAAAQPTATKTVSATGLTSTTGNDLAIGETVTYQVDITIPEGQFLTGARLSDTLPAGMVLMGTATASISASPGFTTTWPGGFDGALASATMSGTTLSLDLGTLQNTDSDAGTIETLTIRYTAVTTNSAGNQAGTTLGGTTSLIAELATLPITSPAMRIVEPYVTVDLSPVVPGASTAEAGGTVDYKLTITTASGGSYTDAYDVQVTYPLPTGLTRTGVFSANGGPVPSDLVTTDSLISVTYAQLTAGTTIELLFTVTLDNAVAAGASLASTVTLTYSSLPGDVSTPQVPGYSSTVERTGSGGLNDYSGSNTDTISTHSSSISGYVYVDRNADGVYSYGFDDPIPNVGLTLTGTDTVGAVVSRTTTTGSDGAYAFGGLRAGTYVLSQPMQPPEFMDGPDRAGFPSNGTPDANGDLIANIVLPQSTSTNAVGYDFSELVDVDLSLTLLASREAARPGDTVDFIVKVTNPSLQHPVYDLVSTIVLPKGLTVTSTSNQTGWNCTEPSPSVLRCTTIALPPDITVQFVFSAQVGAVADHTRLQTVANVTTSKIGDWNAHNNTDTTLLTVPAAGETDLGVTLTAPAQTGDAAGSLLYTAIVTNHSATASAATLTFTPDGSGLSFLSYSSSPSGTTCEIGQTVVCALPTLAVGEKVTLSLEARGDTGRRSLQASVDANGGIADPNPDNDTAVVETTWGGPTNADLQITMTAPHTVAQGQQFRVKHTIKNVGLGSADVTVSDTGAANGLTSISTSPACAFPCSIGTLAAGETYVFFQVYEVSSGHAAGPVTLARTVSAAGDLYAGNDTANVTVRVSDPALVDLTTTLFDTPDPVVSGHPLELVALVTNDGPAAATAAAVTFTAPSTFFASLSPRYTSAGTCTGAYCALGLVRPGETALVAFSVDTPSAVPSTNPVTSTVTATAAAQTDANPASNTATQQTTLTQQADLQITKTITGSGPVIAGTEFVYAITVTNHGPSAAANVIVGDAVANGTTFVSNAGDCATAFPCALGTLAVGETQTISSTYLLASSYTTPATFSAAATISSDASETNASNNSSAPTVTVGYSADLETTVTGPATVSPGRSLTYTVTVTNHGPSDVSSASVTNPVPAGLTMTAASAPCTGPTTPCAFGPLVSGASEVFTFTFAVPSNYAGPSPIVNSASADSDTNDHVNTNDSGSFSTTIAPSADLGVTMTAPSTTQTDSDVTFTITVTNDGPSDVTDAVVSQSVPPTGLTFVNTSNSCPSFPCAIGAIAAGASQTITAIYHVPAGYTTPDPIVHTVQVSSSAIDSVNTNNSATASIAASTDLGVTITDAPDPAAAGANLTYVITVTNAGPTDAIDVTVSDTLPAGTTFVSIAADANRTCTLPAVGAGGTIDCTWPGATAASAARTLTFTVHVDSSVADGTLISNTVTASSDTNESAPTNNSATTTTTVGASTDIAVTMTVDNQFVNVGGEAVFTVTVQNLGPSAATGVAITDAIPLGLTYLDSTPSQGGYDAPSGVWTVGSLAPNASATLQLRVRAEEAGSRVNTAIKTAGDQPDPDSANNSAAINLTSQPTADVSVSKTVNVSSANVGDTVTFTITVGNAGPNDATALRILDALPPGLTYSASNASTGTYDPNGLWLIDTLAMHAQATLTIDAIVNHAGPILNQASKVGQGEDDPNPANDSSGATVNGLSADIQVVTTLATNTAVQVGGEVRFFVTTTNNGPSPATGVRVRDLLPPGLAYLSSTVTQGVYVPASGAWEVGDLAASGPAATAVLELRAKLLSLDGLMNEARVLASDQLDPVASNNFSVVFPLTTSSELVFDIDVQGEPGLFGSLVDYTFQVRNEGSGATAAPLTVAIPLPPEYAYVSVQQAGLRADGPATATATAAAASEWSCTQVGRTLFCRSDATLAQGQTANLVVRLQVNAWLAEDRVLFAYLSTPGGEQVPVRMQQFSLAARDTEADLAVTQSVQVSDGIRPAKILRFTVDVVNHGPREASDVMLTDVLPPGVTYVWAKGPRGACQRTDDFISCELGSIASGASAQVTVDLTVDAPAGVIHAVGVTAGSYDPALGNNSHVLAQRLDGLDYIDTDGDGMPDGWESLVGLSVTTDDAAEDADGDGVSNLDEYRRGTHPRGTDSRYFAEGAVNEFFQTTIAVLNPDAESFASVMIELLQEDGSIRSVPHLLAPLGRVELDPRTLMPDGGAFSVQVESDRPVAVDRDMRWDSSGYGSSGESGAPGTSTTWYFAEGATNPYSLFYLVENPSMTETAQLQVSYLLPGGQPPVVVTDSVAPHSRKTIFVNQLADTHPALRTTEVAATFTSSNNVPIVVERAMYLNLPNQPMGAGHAGLGATSPSTSWFFSEGATGFFKEYLLLANPLPTQTRATVRYLLPNGAAFEKPYDLDPLSRRTIDVAGEDERLSATPVSTVVTATQPIVAERVMWWPNAPDSPYWYEAHVSLGATATGTVWAIAGAAAGGRWAEQTYALLANQEAYDGEVLVTVTVDGGQQASKRFPVAASSRQTIDFAAHFPLVEGRHFSALIESIGATPAPIAVEWSRYGSAGGQLWSSGSAALATKVR